jgi:hypothetical protein
VPFFVTAEFHQAQEQQGSRIAGNLAFQLFADTVDSSSCIHTSLTRHLIDVSQITVEAEVGFNIPDSEVMPQIVFQHGLSPCCINFFFLAKQGKQAQETG